MMILSQTKNIYTSAVSTAVLQKKQAENFPRSKILSSNSVLNKIEFEYIQSTQVVTIYCSVYLAQIQKLIMVFHKITFLYDSYNIFSGNVSLFLAVRVWTYLK